MTLRALSLFGFGRCFRRARGLEQVQLLLPVMRGSPVLGQLGLKLGDRPFQLCGAAAVLAVGGARACGEG